MKTSKKIYGLFLFIIICNLFTSVFAASLEENTSELEASINSGAVLILEESTGKVIYEKNGYDRMFPASTTKIMTAILAIENCDLNEEATASEYAVYSIPDGYSNAGIQMGESLTIKDLLYALMVTSANESAIVLAEHVSGSEEAFCWLMNDKAKELGCKDTNFVNPNGIHKDDHYSTAYDLALIARYAMQNETFRDLVKTTTVSLPANDLFTSEERTFNNTNSLIMENSGYYYEYATGIKTGFTSEAGNCLVSSAEKNGVEYITVVLNAPVEYINGSSVSRRYSDTITLFNFAFENYSFKDLKHTNDLIKTIDINNGSSLDLLIASDVSILTNIDSFNSDFEPEITLNDNLSAPIAKGDVVGTVVYRIDGLKYTADLIAGNDVEPNIINKVFNNKSDNKLVFYIIDGVLIFILLLIIIKSRKRKRRRYR